MGILLEPSIDRVVVASWLADAHGMDDNGRVEDDDEMKFIVKVTVFKVHSL
jgi:hypothetical protein